MSGLPRRDDVKEKKNKNEYEKSSTSTRHCEHDAITDGISDD
jgi:hypothetical protein